MGDGPMSEYRVPTEMFLGELYAWQLGVCETIAFSDGTPLMEREEPDEIRIFGEGHHRIAVVNLDEGELEDWQDEIHEAVQAEMEAL